MQMGTLKFPKHNRGNGFGATPSFVQHILVRSSLFFGGKTLPGAETENFTSFGGAWWSFFQWPPILEQRFFLGGRMIFEDVNIVSIYPPPSNSHK